MSTDNAQLFFSLLTLVAGAGTVVLLGLKGASLAGNRRADEIGGAIEEASVWLAFLVAATATLGSLYFSEIADFVPCRLCWFQRIAMYPLSVVLLVGAVRRDPAVRWYAAPIAVIGAGIALYHYLVEWNPGLEPDSCSLTGPSCSAFWFRELGFVTLAFMALVGFLTILALLFVRFPARLDDGSEAPQPETELVR